jgi:hypothetical protein
LLALAGRSKVERMKTTEPIAQAITEPLTWAEICERYPDEYVCIVDVDETHTFASGLRTARVVGRGKTRREAFDQALPWWDYYKVIGHRFTGQTQTLRRPFLVLDDETRELVRHRP